MPVRRLLSILAAVAILALLGAAVLRWRSSAPPATVAAPPPLPVADTGAAGNEPATAPTPALTPDGAGTAGGAGGGAGAGADEDEAPAARPALPKAHVPSSDEREKRRFSRYDRDDDGRISRDEYLASRRRSFDRLDKNGDGNLSFNEYAAQGIGKFKAADGNGDGVLDAREFATTAPKRSK